MNYDAGNLKYERGEVGLSTLLYSQGIKADKRKGIYNVKREAIDFPSGLVRHQKQEVFDGCRAISYGISTFCSIQVLVVHSLHSQQEGPC